MKRRFERLSPLLLALPLLAAGCSSQQSNDGWSLYLQLVRETVRTSFGDGGITRQQAAAIPYASLGYRINGSREALLVLATDTGGEQMWTSASHVVLNFRDGRLVRTLGLPHDSTVNSIHADTPAPSPAESIKGAFHSTRLVDLPGMSLYSVSVLCNATARGLQTLTILGTKLTVRRVDERCSSSTLRWSFTDTYWVDAKTGFVWRAIQHTDPSTTVEVEILRPPG